MFKKMMDCPKQAEYAVRERLGDESCVISRDTATYHADAGTIVQKLYELYFNQQVNLRPGGMSEQTVANAIAKVLSSKPVTKILAETTFPDGKTMADLRTFIVTSAATGRKALFDGGVLDQPMRSEVASPGEVDGYRIFAFIDFLRTTEKGVYIYDGKINASASADPRQLWYAALTRDEPVLGGGFFYWKLGRYVAVDMSPEAIQKFKEGDFAESRRRWEPILGPGVESLEATPSYAACRFCNWNGMCPSAQRGKVREPNYDLPDEIGWGDLD